jgi:hypothetical protein
MAGRIHYHHDGISITSLQWSHCQSSLCCDPEAEQELRVHASQFIKLEPCENKEGDVNFVTLLSTIAPVPCESHGDGSVPIALCVGNNGADRFWFLLHP